MSKNNLLILTGMILTAFLALMQLSTAEHNPHDIINNLDAIKILLQEPITIAGENCDPTNNLKSSAETMIEIPETREYEIYARASRGSIQQIQLDESYFLQVNERNGPISNDDAADTFSIRNDYLGKFNLDKGQQTIKVKHAMQCPPSNSLNDIAIDVFYLLPLPIPQSEPQPTEPPQETGNLRITNVNIQAGLQLHTNIQPHSEIPIDTTNTNLKIEITIQNQLQKTKINNIQISIKSDSLPLDTTQQINNLIPSQTSTTQLEKDIFNNETGDHKIIIKISGKGEDNKDYEEVFIFHLNYTIFACSDKIDNDNDHLIDLEDPGCESLSDDDETNSITQPPEDNQDDDDHNDEQDSKNHGRKNNQREQYYNCEEIYHDQPNQLRLCQEKYADYRQTLSEENNKIVLLNYEKDITKQISNDQTKTTKMPTLKLNTLLIIFVVVNLLLLILIIIFAIRKR